MSQSNVSWKCISEHLRQKHISFFIYSTAGIPPYTPQDCLVRAGLVVTGSWWGVRRDANSHNLSPGADRLVARKFIQRMLSLHLPYFEVALSTLACRTCLCVHFSPLAIRGGKKRRDGALLCVNIHVCASACDVCSCQGARVCVHVCMCVCVCLTGSESWGKKAGEGGERERGSDAACQSILALENSRSSFHVLPTIGQSVSNQSGA